MWGWIAFLVLPFITFLNIFPHTSAPRDFVAFAILILLLVYAFGKKDREHRISVLVFPATIFFMVAVLIQPILNGPLTPSYYSYLVYFIGVVSLCYLVPTYMATYGIDRFSKSVVIGLGLAGILVGIISLMRHYGVVTFFVSGIQPGSGRLIGPWGQPNLTGLLLTLSTASFVYMRAIGVKVSQANAIIGVVFCVFCGALTLSRAWLVMVSSVAAIPLFKFFIEVACQKKYDLGNTQQGIIALIISLFIIVPLAPKINNALAHHLVGIGFLSEQAVSQKGDRGFSSSARIDEWGNVVSAIDSSYLVLGYGPGRYAFLSASIEREIGDASRNGKLWSHAHNIFLNTLVESGVVGVVLVAFFYVWYLCKFIRVKLSSKNAFFLSIAGVLLLHNLVEFSFWYFPFLAIFIISMTFLSGSFKLRFSSVVLPRSLAVLVALVLIPAYVINLRDYYESVSVYMSADAGVEEYGKLNMRKGSPLLGADVEKLIIYKFTPPTARLEAYLERMEELMLWRPEQLYRIRHASISAALEKQEACQSIEDTIRFYPDSIVKIQNEIDFYKDQGLINKSADFSECVSKGIAPWL